MKCTNDYFRNYYLHGTPHSTVQRARAHMHFIILSFTFSHHGVGVGVGVYYTMDFMKCTTHYCSGKSFSLLIDSLLGLYLYSFCIDAQRTTKQLGKIIRQKVNVRLCEWVCVCVCERGINYR